MSLFHAILQTLKEKYTDETNRTTLIAELCSKTLGTTITPEQISYKDQLLIIQAPPTVKMALKIKSEELQSLLASHHIKVHTIR